MTLTAQLRGTLVHVMRKPYDFDARDGSGRMQGTTRQLFVVTDPESPPNGVKFRNDQSELFENLATTLKAGDKVAFEVNPGPRDNPNTHQFVSVVEVNGQRTTSKASAAG